MKTTVRFCRFLSIFTAAAFLLSMKVQAVSVGQIDTFEDGTTQGWVVGVALGVTPPVPPQNATGGPGGTDDNFLLLTANGLPDAPGGRLSVLNLAQWAGNYIAEGVGAISMDVANFGPEDLALRLMFEDPMGGPPANIAFSQDPVLLPAGGGWTHVVFPIGISDLQAGIGDVSAALSGATAIRIYHSPGDNFPGFISPIPPVVVELGVDNIRAELGISTPVSDGGSTALLLLAAAMILGALRQRVG